VRELEEENEIINTAMHTFRKEKKMASYTDREIFLNNFEKYANPEKYDEEYGSCLKDLPFLLEWAKKKGGPIIDLACGTGRITIPLANEGFTILGVDLHEGMLQRAMQKAVRNQQVISWHLQNCTDLSLPVKSPFIYMTGNSFQHFLTNAVQERLLKRVRKHLDKDGIFIFGTRFPVMSELQNGENSISVYKDQNDREIREHIMESYDHLTQVLTSTSKRVMAKTAQSPEETEEDSISLRYVFPQEMERLLYSSGFSILHSYGSWDKTPLNGDSKEMIYVCQKRNR
jgi:SAM-dependent methyltransferase